MNIRNCCYVMLFLVATFFSSSVSAYHNECHDAFVSGTMSQFNDCESYYNAVDQRNEALERAAECQKKLEWCQQYPDDFRCPPSC